MRFVIARNALQRELTFVQGIVERKNTIPVLANILIESAGENSIRISGTDLDVTIRCDTDADEISSQGAICVQARKLFDIARLLPDAPVSFRKEENEWVTVECNRSKFRLPGISKDTFPELPGFKSTPLKLPAALIKLLIDRTIFAITQEEGRCRSFAPPRSPVQSVLPHRSCSTTASPHPIYQSPIRFFLDRKAWLHDTLRLR